MCLLHQAAVQGVINLGDVSKAVRERSGSRKLYVNVARIADVIWVHWHFTSKPCLTWAFTEKVQVLPDGTVDFDLFVSKAK